MSVGCEREVKINTADSVTKVSVTSGLIDNQMSGL